MAEQGLDKAAAVALLNEILKGHGAFDAAPV